MSILIGIAVGLVLGLTGAGGSVFAVPMLMFGLGWTLPQAAPVALLAVCAATGFGTIVAWDLAYVRYRAALLMAAAGLLTAPLGLQLSRSLPADLLGLAFAGVLLLVAVRAIVQARRRPVEARIVRATVAGDVPDERGPYCRLHPVTGRIVWARPCVVLMAAIGSATGFLSALLGVGGGFLIVPALRAATPLSMHSAVATSLLAIALTSAATTLVTVALGAALPWALALPFVLGALLGMYGGRLLAPRIAGPALQQGFAVAMLGVAGILALRSIH